MGKVLVLYDSASGNTARIARLVAEGAGSTPSIKVRLHRVDEATAEDVMWCAWASSWPNGSPISMTAARTSTR